MAEHIRVQICYAKPERVVLLDVNVAPGTTLQQAVEASGILQAESEIDMNVCKLGIYGKLKPLDTVLRDRDRIEIYRPLIVDPKEARRRRVVKKETARRRA
jgi:hypothetical protein